LTFTPGTSLGPYEILSPLGAGGMGEVYRAKDTRLDREVAIKVLPETLARDKERIARFQREAKVLASLNHPNIAAVYGFEEADKMNFLVMELVEGETLAERLMRGAIPVEQSLEFAKQITEALEAAHDKGIIHRDLKPANVKVSPEDKIKVLDFGLAKALAGGDESSQTENANSPTITAGFTRPGVILGTAAYMSPEQARGKPLDKRTDIWSFGCMLYEFLTGHRIFGGETTSDAIGAILHKEPDWTALPPNTPPTVQLLLRRCLAKDRKQRLRDIGDARIEIESALSDPTASSLDSNRDNALRRSSPVKAVALVALVATISAVTTWVLKSPPQGSRPVLRKLEIQVDGLRRDEGYAPVISPDGTRVLYAANGSLWVRSLGDLDAIELSGTQGANLPFWSPDSAQIGFHDGSRLWRMPATGGARTMICVTPRMLEAAGGVAWMPDGRVVFTIAWGGPFWEAPVGGGEPRAMFNADPEEVQDFHCASALPDGSGVLSILHRPTGKPDSIVLVRGDSFEVLLEHSNEELLAPAYANGYIVYGRVQTTGTIWAAPFSLESHQVTGPSFLVSGSGESPSVSSDGTLVYATSTYVGTGQLVWVERKGVVTDAIGEPQQGLRWPVVSPDDAMSAAFATETGAAQIWVYDLARRTRRPITVDKGASWITGWLSNDRLAFTARSKTYTRSMTGSDPPQLLVDSDSTTISSDQRYMAVEHRVDKSFDIFYYDLHEHGAARPFLATQATEQEPAFRPGGGWLAYVSDETGRDEMYLIGFPSGIDKRQVSFNGGTWPRWSPRGDELFYGTDRTDDADLMCVGVTSEPELKLTEPQRLFNGADSEINLQKGWSVSSDGQRILGVRDVLSKFETSRITVVENWFAEFKDRP